MIQTCVNNKPKKGGRAQPSPIIFLLLALGEFQTKCEKELLIPRRRLNGKFFWVFLLLMGSSRRGITLSCCTVPERQHPNNGCLFRQTEDAMYISGDT